MMTNKRQLFAKIVEAAPDFQHTMDEHVAYNEELLAHLLMADCGRFIASYFTGEKKIASGPPTALELRRVLEVIDSALLDGDDETVNVVAVSFVENVWEEPYFLELQSFLGPNVRKEIERQRTSPSA